jgi:Zn-dependent peptidase ImmA (M78 family)
MEPTMLWIDRDTTILEKYKQYFDVSSEALRREACMDRENYMSFYTGEYKSDHETKIYQSDEFIENKV